LAGDEDLITKKITMQDIADSLGVSKVTVSKAINDKPGVGLELKKKILDVATEMDYKINSIAKALKTNRTGNIGVIISDVFFTKNEYFYTKIFRYIEMNAVAGQYNTILTIATEENELTKKTPLMCMEQKVDGLLILGQISNQYLAHLKRLNTPIVLIDFYYRDINLDHIVTDNFYASYIITSHLIESGHTDIGFCGNVNLYSSIQDRFLGYQKALLERKIKYNESFLIMERDDKGAYIDIQLPEKNATAYVCNCDKAAYLLGRKLNSKGFKVPGDVSIVGFDDVEFSTMFQPNITTVRIRIEDMARKAVKQIMRRIDHDEGSGQRIVIGAEIVYRDSVKKLIDD